MNASAYEHPSLKLAVTDEQRDRASHWLQEAYADGRLSEDDFDHRIGQVLSATNRREMNSAFYGLVSVPMPSQALGLHPAYQPSVLHHEKVGRGAAAFAHFSALFTWIFGPLVVFLTATKGGYARREAAKAFNFQIVAMLSLIVAGILSSILLPDAIDNVLFPLVWLGWLLGTVVGGAKAAAGENWTNPAKKVIRLDLLPER